eukprot:3719311-Rhodomonas_salina.1
MAARRASLLAECSRIVLRTVWSLLTTLSTFATLPNWVRSSDTSMSFLCIYELSCSPDRLDLCGEPEEAFHVFALRCMVACFLETKP